MNNAQPRMAATLFSSAFAPDGDHVVVSSSTGHLYVWRLSVYTDRSFWEAAGSSSASPSSSASASPSATSSASACASSSAAFPSPATSDKVCAPHVAFEAHRGPIYDVTFAGSGSDPLLVSAADEEIRVWRWADIVAAMEAEQQILADDTGGSGGGLPSASLRPVTELCNPREDLGRGALAMLTETNAVATDPDNATALYSAAGDNNAYIWDIAAGTCVTALAGHTDYLHCIAYLPSVRGLATTSEDGSLRLWDVRGQQCTGTITPFPDDAFKAATALAVDDGSNWMAVGGSSCRGAAAVVCHLGSREITCRFDPKGNDVFGMAFKGDKLFTVGDGNVVEHWQHSTGALMNSVKTRATAAPLYNVAVGTKGVSRHFMLVLGSSPHLDVLLNGFGNAAFALSTC